MKNKKASSAHDSNKSETTTCMSHATCSIRDLKAGHFKVVLAV